MDPPPPTTLSGETPFSAEVAASLDSTNLSKRTPWGLVIAGIAVLLIGGGVSWALVDSGEVSSAGSVPEGLETPDLDESLVVATEVIVEDAGTEDANFPDAETTAAVRSPLSEDRVRAGERPTGTVRMRPPRADAVMVNAMAQPRVTDLQMIPTAVRMAGEQVRMTPRMIGITEDY